MIKLEAINRMARTVGDYPFTALDTGASSDAGLAEAILDDTSRDIQTNMSWRFNFRDQVELTVPDVRIVVTGGSGTFVYDETVTESVSGATGTFACLQTVGATTYMHIRKTVGGTAFTGGQTLTGTTSAATKTGGTYTAMTSNIIPDPNWTLAAGGGSLSLVAYDRSVSVQDGLLFDHQDNTTTWQGSVWVDYNKYVAFTSVPHAVAAYIADAAAVMYCAQFGDRSRLPEAERKAAMSRVTALQAEERSAAVNIITQSRHVQRIRGEAREGNPWYSGGRYE